MNDVQLYDYYLSIPLATLLTDSPIYPEYVVITGFSCHSPHPHRYYSFEEFVEALETKEGFREFLEKK